MRVRDIDFSAYPHKRICVEALHGPLYFPPDCDDIVKRIHGDEEVEQASSDEDGNWLTITLVKPAADNAANSSAENTTE